MSYEECLVDIISNTPGGVIIYSDNIYSLLGLLEPGDGFVLKSKNIQDDYISRQGYSWQRVNKRKFLVWIQND